jgi:hypothetical protein
MRDLVVGDNNRTLMVFQGLLLNIIGRFAKRIRSRRPLVAKTYWSQNADYLEDISR